MKLKRTKRDRDSGKPLSIMTMNQSQSVISSQSRWINGDHIGWYQSYVENFQHSILDVHKLQKWHLRQ